jgi:pimeloyl-ACP methyl ester carboxylesterase
MFTAITLAKLGLFGQRLPLTRTPSSVDLDYEDIAFSATDGVRLRGWFIPSGSAHAPTVIWVHGWMWNRAGNIAGRVPFRDRDVDFFPATRALHDAGFNVLMFDLANHGQSGKRLPLTQGPWEARDFVGAVRYARSRPEVDGERIGVIGMSAGGNTVFYGTPHCQPIRAVLAVQPTKVRRFNARFSLDEVGVLGPLVAASADIVNIFLRAPLYRNHDPAKPLARIGDTVVQYVQGAGDPWGELGVVEAFSAATPHSLGVQIYPSPSGRYEGYRYVSNETHEVVAFFRAHV